MTYKIHMFLMALVIIGAINWGFEAFDHNLVKLLSNFLNNLMNSNYPIDKIIYIIVAIAGFSLAIKRDSWLPFLGWTILPSPILDLQIPEKYDTKVKIKVEPNTKVVYWASSNKGYPDMDVVSAYSDYKNSGVVLSDDTGIVELRILSGDSYVVPMGYTVDRHIHYRIVKCNGTIGPVNTVTY